jgi:hypothetical protein
MSDDNIPPDKRSTTLLPRPVVPKGATASERQGCGRALLVRLHPTDPPQKLEARCVSLARTGIRLHLPYPLDVDSVVILHLRGRVPAQSATLPARVTSATNQGDGTWLVGCRFDRQLEQEALKALL